MGTFFTADVINMKAQYASKLISSSRNYSIVVIPNHYSYHDDELIYNNTEIYQPHTHSSVNIPNIYFYIEKAPNSIEVPTEFSPSIKTINFNSNDRKFINIPLPYNFNDSNITQIDTKYSSLSILTNPILSTKDPKYFEDQYSFPVKHFKFSLEFAVLNSTNWVNTNLFKISQFKSPINNNFEYISGISAYLIKGKIYFNITYFNSKSLTYQAQNTIFDSISSQNEYIVGITIDTCNLNGEWFIEIDATTSTNGTYFIGKSALIKGCISEFSDVDRISESILENNRYFDNKFSSPINELDGNIDYTNAIKLFDNTPYMNSNEPLEGEELLESESIDHGIISSLPVTYGIDNIDDYIYLSIGSGTDPSTVNLPSVIYSNTDSIFRPRFFLVTCNDYEETVESNLKCIQLNKLVFYTSKYKEDIEQDILNPITISIPQQIIPVDPFNISITTTSNLKPLAEVEDYINKTYLGTQQAAEDFQLLMKVTKTSYWPVEYTIDTDYHIHIKPDPMYIGVELYACTNKQFLYCKYDMMNI